MKHHQPVFATGAQIKNIATNTSDHKAFWTVMGRFDNCPKDERAAQRMFERYRKVCGYSLK